MHISDQRIVEVLKTTKIIIEELKTYTLNGHSPPVSIEDLQHVVGAMNQMTIKKYEVIKAPGKAIRGSVARYADSATILVDSGLPDTLKRFTAAKEICQIAIDKERDWSTDAHKTIGKLLTTFELETKLNGAHTVEEDVIVSEILAEIAATEVLYPLDLRAADKQKLNMPTSKVTYATLEAHYKIPRAYIGRALASAYDSIALMAADVYSGKIL